MRLKNRHIGRTEAADGAAGASDPRDGAPTGTHIAGTETAGQRAPARGWRTRRAGASAVGTVGAGAVMLALLLITAAVLVALLIALAILLADEHANPGNAVAKGLHDSANFFAGSFTGLLRFDGHPDRAISVNWGIAAIVYLLVGAILARAIFIAGRGGVHFGERHRTSVANY